MNKGDYIKSLLKAIAVLQCFSSDELTPSAADIATKVGIPKPTAYRIIKTLVYGKLLEQNEKAGTYKIGPVLYMLGSLYLSTTDIIKAAEPVTKALNEMTSEAVNVSIFNDGYITVILKEEPQHPFRWGVHIGRTSFAYTSSMGKAMLSDYTDEEIDRIYPEENLEKVTAKTIATKAALKRELKEIRRIGVAFNTEGHIQGINGVGTAIRDGSGKAVASVGFAFPTFRINQARLNSLAALIKMGGSLISYRLGYRDTDNPVRDIQEIRSWWKQNQSALTQ